MKFSAGCVLGLLLGVILAILVYFGYAIVFSPENLPLIPASGAANPDITITMGQQYLNDQLSKGMALRGLKLSNLTVALHASNRAEATMTMPISIEGQSFEVQPDVSFHFADSNGLVTFDLDNVTVSGFTIPQNLIDQQIGTFKGYAQDQLNADLRRALANSSLHVVGIQSSEGALTVQLSR